jgi:hypothetical protein
MERSTGPLEGPTTRGVCWINQSLDFEAICEAWSPAASFPIDTWFVAPAGSAIGKPLKARNTKEYSMMTSVTELGDSHARVRIALWNDLGDCLETWVEPMPSWRGSLKEPVEVPFPLFVVLSRKLQAPL